MEKIKNIKLPNGEVYELGGSGLDGKITNCITEIPQRIKLELNNGTLTLKAGSEVIVPNGFEADGTTPKFDYVTVESDIVVSFTGSDRTCLYVPNATKTGLERYPLSMIFSGSTAPTSNSIWYDTGTNIIKKSTDAGVTWTSGLAFPIGLFTESASGVAAVNNVFNGFGYIGQCTWVDKGVKALFADGRNEDGTLKNIERVTTTVNITNLQNQTSILSRFDGNNLWGYGVNGYYEHDTKPTITGDHAMWFSPLENQLYVTGNGGATWSKICGIVGKLTKLDANGSITDMTTMKTFRAVDYNEALRELGSGKSANGYCKLSNGLIVQWGSLSISASTSVVVTLPTPFSSTNYMALSSMYSNSSSDSSKNWQTSTLTTTSFKAHNGQGGTCKFGWLAIGF